METLLKKYDKFLIYRKKMDGSIKVYRQSPFNSQREHLILDIKNQYPGRWILDKLMSMDTQRFDKVTRILKNNRRISEDKKDDRVSRDIGEFLYNDEKVVL